MRRKGLVLPGYACTSQIWHSIRGELDTIHEITWVDWPTKLLGEFHTVEDFACWLLPSLQPAHYDFVIGHSMGGLVALALAQKDPGLFRQVVLVETFLTPPTSFFQNLFVQKDLGEDARMILDMLEREKGSYSPRLRENLRQVDVSRDIANLGTKVQAVYGDRGCGEVNRVLEELAWPQELRQRVAVSVVSNASHFLMIENAEMTTHVLRSMLQEE